MQHFTFAVHSRNLKSDVSPRIGGRCFENSLVILRAWTIWKHRNDCVFNAARLSIEAALSLVKKEADLWLMVGARGLSSLAVMRVG